MSLTGTVVYSYDLTTKELKQRSWPSVANCSAAVRWLGRYYCFQGIQFLRFDPVTGQVGANYPRDARDYFMRCPGRGKALPQLNWGGQAGLDLPSSAVQSGIKEAAPPTHAHLGQSQGCDTYGWRSLSPLRVGSDTHPYLAGAPPCPHPQTFWGSGGEGCGSDPHPHPRFLFERDPVCGRRGQPSSIYLDRLGQAGRRVGRRGGRIWKRTWSGLLLSPLSP